MALSEATCIQARLTLRTTTEGGRQTGIKTGYRPNHVFEYKNDGQFQNTYIGEIRFDKDKTILPGENCNRDSLFSNASRLRKIFTSWPTMVHSRMA